MANVESLKIILWKILSLHVVENIVSCVFKKENIVYFVCDELHNIFIHLLAIFNKANIPLIISGLHAPEIFALLDGKYSVFQVLKKIQYCVFQVISVFLF